MAADRQLDGRSSAARRPSGRIRPHEPLRHPAALERVADIDEAGLISEVLSDPDQAMAQSAALRYLDRRANGLHPGPAYEPWAEMMTRATTRYPFLAQRLREWALFRAVTLGQPWAPNAAALEILADSGRTKRIRNTARTSPRHQGQR